MSFGYQSGALPPIESFSRSPVKVEENDTPRRPQLPSISTNGSVAPQMSSNYAASFPPPSPSRPHSPSFGAQATSGVSFSSSSDYRRIAGEEKEMLGSANSSSRPLSLPSISEALARDSMPVPTSAASSQFSYSQRVPESPRYGWSASNEQPSHVRDQSQDHRPSRAPYVGSIAPATPEAQPASLSRRTYSSRPSSFVDNRPYDSQQHVPLSPRLSSPRTSAGQQWPPPPPARYDSYTRAAEPQLPHYPYSQQKPYAYGVAPSSAAETPLAYATHSQYQSHPDSWQPTEPYHAEKKPAAPYSDSVKMHLNNYDFETALNEIAASSHQLFEFSQHYGQLAHQSQKSTSLPGSIPNVMEVDTMIKHGGRVSDSLLCLRDMIASQEAAIAERTKEQVLHKVGKHALQEDAQDIAREGSFANDAKKRRGRAAPPGRCHSCNRAETPEWRRGPDGARTLCNACGLHYAKSTRKLGVNKQPLGSSNLRPKSISGSSPTA